MARILSRIKPTEHGAQILNETNDVLNKMEEVAAATAGVQVTPDVIHGRLGDLASSGDVMTTAIFTPTHPIRLLDFNASTTTGTAAMDFGVYIGTSPIFVSTLTSNEAVHTVARPTTWDESVAEIAADTPILFGRKKSAGNGAVQFTIPFISLQE